MKKRTFALVLGLLLILNSTSLMATTVWFQDTAGGTSGKVESEIEATAVNGSVELLSGSLTTDSSPLNRSAVKFKFTADSGYELDTRQSSMSSNDPNQDGYYFNADLKALFSNSDYDDVLPNMDSYFDLVVNQEEVGSDNEYVILSVNVVRNGVPYDSEVEVVRAHMEPELSGTVTVQFVKKQIEEEYYNVTARSIPEGVATFTGTGSGFMSGDSYSVDYSITNSNYEFDGWDTPNSGNIVETDVEVVARFKEKPTPPPVLTYYFVTAESNPVGVASFTGTGYSFVSGQSYSVDYTLIDDDYEFVGWSAEPSGVISGNVSLVANFSRPTYDVTARSIPAGVASFSGTMSDIVDGTAYEVTIDSVVDGYQFDEWVVSPIGTINGSDVEVVASFSEIEEETIVDEEVAEETILDEEVAEDIPDEELPEAGGIPIIAYGFLGTGLITLGKKLRK